MHGPMNVKSFGGISLSRILTLLSDIFLVRPLSTSSLYAKRVTFFHLIILKDTQTQTHSEKLAWTSDRTLAQTST
jgi:hypothetical protein